MSNVIPTLKRRRLTAILAAAMVVTLGCNASLHAQSGSVSRSGSTWTATANGSTVYTGSRMFDAVNAACGNAGSGATIDIWNSGDSSTSPNGNLYYIRPLANQTLDFHGNTINCNGGGDSIVAIYNDRRHGNTISNLRITGNPRYGIWYRGCNDVTLNNITIEYSGSSPVGLGIRVDSSTGSAGNLTISGTTNVSGTNGHGIETYGIDGFSIGDVTVNDTGGAGLLLNDSRNGTVGNVVGNWNNWGGGYATFRVANSNGPNVTVDSVYSRNSGRGVFSVSDSHGTTIDSVDIDTTWSHGIFLEDASDTHILSGNVCNGNPNVQEVRTSNTTVNVTICGSGGGTTYDRLRNRATDLYVDGMGHTANGSNLGQWANTNHQNAHWEVVLVGNYRKFRNRSTSLYIDGMGRTSNGSDAGQWSDGSSHNQQWWRTNPSSGYYKFQNRATGLYLDGMGRTSNGSNVGQWSNSSSHNQQFQYVSP